VLKREFKEGGEVETGQRLYQIDPAPYIAALNSATASLQKAVANIMSTTAQAERYKVLVAANAASKQEYDNAVAVPGQGAADVAAGRLRLRRPRSTLVTPTSYRRSPVGTACRWSPRAPTCRRAPRRS
jgi:membrane fusion protein (multidrug efflux system)